MAIDPRIALGVQPLQIQQQDPNQGLNALARMMQISGSMDEAKVNALKLQEAQHGIARRNKLDSIVGVDYAKPEDRETALIKSGFIEEADKLGKTRREAAKADLEMGLKKAEHAGSLFMLAKDPQTYGVVRSLVKQQLGQDMPEQYDPMFVQGQIAMGQTLTQRMQAEHQRLTLAETGRHNLSSEGIQIRGQNMTDARSRESNAQGRVPSGYRQKADGTLEFIPGGPADPNAAKKAAPTEFQGKAAMFGNRAQEADRIIAEMEGKYSPAGINAKQATGNTPLVGGALEAGANMMLSKESQKAEQAQRDFINAVLRLESGAAIAQSEFDNAKKQYFPQPGDGREVIAQKAQNRKTAIQGLLNNARPGAVEQSGGATGGWEASPTVESLLKKYGGK